MFSSFKKKRTGRFFKNGIYFSRNFSVILWIKTTFQKLFKTGAKTFRCFLETCSTEWSKLNFTCLKQSWWFFCSFHELLRISQNFCNQFSDFEPTVVIGFAKTEFYQSTELFCLTTVIKKWGCFRKLSTIIWASLSKKFFPRSFFWQMKIWEEIFIPIIVFRTLLRTISQFEQFFFSWFA